MYPLDLWSYFTVIIMIHAFICSSTIAFGRHASSMQQVVGQQLRPRPRHRPLPVEYDDEPNDQPPQFNRFVFPLTSIDVASPSSQIESSPIFPLHPQARSVSTIEHSPQYPQRPSIASQRPHSSSGYRRPPPPMQRVTMPPPPPSSTTELPPPAYPLASLRPRTHIVQSVSTPPAVEFQPDAVYQLRPQPPPQPPPPMIVEHSWLVPPPITTTTNVSPITAVKSTVHPQNYCDRSMYDDTQLAAYGLVRVDYFLFNTSCSQTFYQCSIGQTFALQCPSETQAFDRAIVNCNFRNSVRECPEYDHVMHCSVKETCNELEFACCALPQSCVPLSRRCDGQPDCPDAEDENNCPSCAPDEFACVKSGGCISSAQRCDGRADDCQDGSNMDELNCGSCPGKYHCAHVQTLAMFGAQSDAICVDWDQHCDGVKDCPSGEDEMNCKMRQAKYLLCENQKQSVTKRQWCDGHEDCEDHSDEKYCY